MNRRVAIPQRRPIVLLHGMIIALMVTLVFGCNQDSRQKALTFFFTGVPQLEDVGEKKLGDQSTTVQEKLLRPATTILSSHSFFTEKHCNACHQTSLTINFNRGDQIGASIRGRSASESPGKLKTPLQKICLTCHKDKTVGQVEKKGLKIHVPRHSHAPVNCNLCHLPHQSEYPYLLKNTPFGLCSQCHSIILFKRCEFNPDRPDCMQCHNPHLGKNRLLLRRDYQEIKVPIDPQAVYPTQ